MAKKLSTIDALRRAGVHTARTEHIKERLEGFDEILNKIAEDIEKTTPLETLKAFEKKILELAGLIRKNAVPWAKAGTDSYAGELVACWERLGALTKRDLMFSRELLEDYDRMAKPLTKEAKQRLFDISWIAARTEIMIIEKEYLSRSLILAAKCWRGEDMTVEDAVTIMSNFPPRIEREDITRDNLFGQEET